MAGIVEFVAAATDSMRRCVAVASGFQALPFFLINIRLVNTGFTLPVVTGPVTAVTSFTGLDRFRYRPVTNRWISNI
jgi:hypothetical protein